MGRLTAQESLKSKIRALVADNVETQDKTRKLIEEVLAKIQGSIENGQAGIEKQVEMLSTLATCTGLIGRSNESLLKSLHIIDAASAENDDDNGDVTATTPETLLEDLAGKAKARRR